MNRFTILFVVCNCCLYGEDTSVPERTMTADEIMDRVEKADRERKRLLPGYISVRDYTVHNDSFDVLAKMKVEVTVDKTGTKRFRIIKTDGPAILRKLVLQRMLDGEKQASSSEANGATDISRQNYNFKLLDSVTIGGRSQYILYAEPRTSNQYLFEGKIWVDPGYSAVTRIEGSPAKNPSFWTRKGTFIHEYAEYHGQWLAKWNRSQSNIRIFGQSSVTIEYGDYRMLAPVTAGPVNRQEKPAIIPPPPAHRATTPTAGPSAQSPGEQEPLANR